MTRGEGWVQAVCTAASNLSCPWSLPGAVAKQTPGWPDINILGGDSGSLPRERPLLASDLGAKAVALVPSPPLSLCRPEVLFRCALPAAAARGSPVTQWSVAKISRTGTPRVLVLPWQMAGHPGQHGSRFIFGLFFPVLSIEPKASHMLGKGSSQAFDFPRRNPFKVTQAGLEPAVLPPQPPGAWL